MNESFDNTRTIIALATSMGSGSISVIRISGKDAICLVNKIFNGNDLIKAKANTTHYGKLIYKRKEIDQVIVSLFRSPHSYTGEDSIEISCHANPYIVNDIIECLIELGAYQANAGEFTLRAFLNGKIDLSRAEAVSNVIQAKSRAGVNNAIQQLEGMLYKKINFYKQAIIETIAHLEIDLDFADENIIIASPREIIKTIETFESEVADLVASYNYAKILSAGITMTIIGAPNVGKSTLLNTLLGEKRAITSHIPGTTRDTIHENLLMNDIYFKIIDTAGLRETDDHIEFEGIKRAKSKIKISDIILLLIDISKPLSEASQRLIEKTLNEYKNKIIIIANKKDLGESTDNFNKLNELNVPFVKISAKSGDGINELKNVILENISREYERFSDDIVITNMRQKKALEKSLKCIKRAKSVIVKGIGYEFAVVELREALSALGEITGETVTDDILNKIFSNFCIGK